jgi:hypothetical protein
MLLTFSRLSYGVVMHERSIINLQMHAIRAGRGERRKGYGQVHKLSLAPRLYSNSLVKGQFHFITHVVLVTSEYKFNFYL